MNCTKCGYPLTENDQFCKNCGTPVAPQGQVGVQMQQPMPSVAPTPNVAPTPGPMPGPTPGPMPGPMQGPMPGPMPGPNMTQQPEPKKNNAILYVIIGILAVAVIVVLILFITSKGNVNNGGNGGTGTGGDNPSVVVTKSYKINFGGFTFTIPDNILYKIDNDELLLGDEENTWMVAIGVMSGSYSQVKANMAKVQPTYQQKGYNATPAAIKTYNGVEFVTTELEKGGEKRIVAFGKLNAMYVAGIDVLTQDYDIDYKVLEKVAPIIGSAEQTQAANSITGYTRIDMTGIEELFQ